MRTVGAGIQCRIVDRHMNSSVPTPAAIRYAQLRSHPQAASGYGTTTRTCIDHERDGTEKLTSPPMARLVGNLRYLVIVAVIGIAAQAVATFGWAVVVTVDFIDDLVRTSAWQEDDTVIALLQVLDLYLVGTVLIITSIGLYELFIGEVQLPEWLVIRTLSDLKAKIVDVIVLVIGIKFLERLVQGGVAIDIFWYGLASAVVMAVLIAWNTLKTRQ